MFHNFGNNAKIRRYFLGLICFATLFSYGAALQRALSSRRAPMRIRQQRPADEACSDFEKEIPIEPYQTSYIINPKFALAGDYPFMAALGYSESEVGSYDFRCAGTLIHDRFVLTAAHCVKRIEPTIVRLGVSYLNETNEHKMDVPIKQIHIHPEFSMLYNTNDVALIEFENPIPRSFYIRPTCLYTSSNLQENSTLYAVGWGLTDFGIGKPSDILSKKTMKLLADSTSREYNNDIIQGYFWAYNNEQMTFSCLRDSGGPLIFEEDEALKKYRQVGITSHRIGCGANAPGAFPKVSTHLDYIESIVWP